MPKGKKKGKFEHRRTEQPYSSDEDDMTLDNCSTISGQSDLKSNEETAENEVQEKLEEKIMDLVDGLSARSAAGRATALSALRGALQRRYLATLLASHSATLSDHVARTLRRGRDAERRAAAALAPLLALQIGEEGTEQFVNEVRPALLATVTDKAASLETRVDCCTSLSALCYLLEEDLSEIVEALRTLESVFSGSYLKGDGRAKLSTEGAVHAAALDAWALLLSLVPVAHARALLRERAPSLAQLAELLHASATEVRVAAGGALALCHEHTDESPDEWLAHWAAWGGWDEVLARLDELARDSHKYHAKRDRKLQRATFRDVLKYFEEGSVCETTVRVGSERGGERVELHSWTARARYTALASALGGGLHALAPHSPPLRAALALPPPHQAPLAPSQRPNKLQRHLQNNAACKARTLARNKNRDKRTATVPAL